MAVPALKKRLLTVDEYQRMAEAGILSEDERVELLRGEIYEMAPIGDRHVACLMWLLHLLGPLRTEVLFSVQSSIRLRGKKSMPQPDLVLVRHRGRPTGVPNPEDIPLLIEVCDSSFAEDLNVKIPLYAASGIPEAWLIDLNRDLLLVFRLPSPKGYQEIRELRRGDRISPEAFPELSVSVDEILGSR